MPLIRPDLLDGYEPYSSAGMEAGKDPENAFLNANENPFPNPGQDGYNRYDIQQPKSLAEAVAAAYGVSPQNFVMTQGSDQVLDLIVRVFCGAGKDAVVTCPPTFGMYKVCAKIQNAGHIEVPLIKTGGTFALDSEAVITRGKEENVKIIFLCAPNSPTGTAFPREEIKRICTALENKAAVVVDEAYIEFSAQDSLLKDMDAHPNLIVTRTMSKAYALAGERLGLGFSADVELIGLLKGVLAPYPIAKSVAASAKAALSPDNAPQVQKNIRTLLSERKRLEEAFGQSSLVTHIYPSDTNFLFIEFADAHGLWTHCKEHKTILRDFSARKGTENALRISVGTPEENTRLLDLLKEYEQKAAA